MLSALALVFAYAVAPNATAASNLTMTVESTSAEGKWSCILDLWITTEVTRGKDADKVTVTVHAPHARMEAAPGSPARFRDTIAAESPSQQQAIALLDGKSLWFEVDRKSGALQGAKADAARFAAEVSFAGVDAGYWFALIWVAAIPKGADGGEHVALSRTRATAWGVPWKLAGDVTLSPNSYLASSGTLQGDLVVGRGANTLKRHVKIEIAPR